MSDSVSIEEMVEAYRKVRDAIAKRKEDFESQMEKLEKSLEVISAAILEFCNAHNLDSVKTPMGTVSRRVQTRYWTNDWESMYRFIEDHKVPDLLERRIHQTNMKTWIEDNPGLLPQGLNNESRYSATVRRSK